MQTVNRLAKTGLALTRLSLISQFKQPTVVLKRKSTTTQPVKFAKKLREKALQQFKNMADDMDPKITEIIAPLQAAVKEQVCQ